MYILQELNNISNYINNIDFYSNTSKDLYEIKDSINQIDNYIKNQLTKNFELLTDVIKKYNKTHTVIFYIHQYNNLDIDDFISVIINEFNLDINTNTIKEIKDLYGFNSIIDEIITAIKYDLLKEYIYREDFYKGKIAGICNTLRSVYGENIKKNFKNFCKFHKYDNSILSQLT